MKKLVLALVLLIGTASFNSTVEAQNINISVNIGRQPAWGPVGYDYAGYYYFPDIDCYYDVNMELFHYMDRGRWISARYLPYAYRHYDLYTLYKVVLNSRDPWRHHHIHHRDYARYRGHRNQFVIRDSRDMRYHDSRNNRVSWHSSDKKHYNNKKDNRYNDNRYSNNGRKEYKYNDNSRRSEKNSHKYNPNKSNQKKENKQSAVRPNRSSTRNDNKKTYNFSNSSRSNANNKSTRNVRQATSSRSTNHSKESRLVSGSERSSRGR